MKPAPLVLLVLASCPGYSVPEPPAPVRPSTCLEAKTLKALPYVHAVEYLPASEKPTRQIVHILDWHFVPRADFAADIRAEAEKVGVTLSDADVDGNWESFLAEVEAVQLEQMALLRSLANSHGLKQVFLEGIAEDEMPGFKNLLGHLSRWKKPKGTCPLDEFLIEMHRQDTLEVCAAGRLMMTGEVEALPAEDADALEAANPVKDGKVQFDESANERREDAIVRNVLASDSPAAVLLLGGGHDLADNVERIGGGQVEYVRVQVEAHKKAAGEGLQGTWVVVSSEADSKPLSFPTKGTLYTFVDGKVRVRTIKEKGKDVYTFKTDPKKNPKEIDLMQEIESREHEKIKVVLCGIYREENDRLFICAGVAKPGADNVATGERPKEFKSSPNAHMVIFDRAKDE